MSETQTIIKTKPTLIKRLVNYVGCVVIVLSLLLNFYMILAISTMSGSEMNQNVLKSGNEDSIVAAYNIEGTINAETARDFDRFYRSTIKDEKVKAILLRVDSPGGTVSASEQIAHQIGKLKKAGKKIVVSMGALAASGGYLISAGADHIVAEKSTITGSIGVIAQVPNCKELMDKIGVKMQFIKSSDAKVWKDMLNPFRDTKNFEIKRMVNILNQMQQSFNQTVKQGRGDKLKLKTEIITNISTNNSANKDIKPTENKITETAPLNGKIYTAIEAKNFGLIDQIGYQDAAIEQACKLIGNPNAKVIKYSFKDTAELLRSIIFGKSELPKIATDIVESKTSAQFMMIWKPSL